VRRLVQRLLGAALTKPGQCLRELALAELRLQPHRIDA